MKVQDINNTDISIWNQYVNYYQNNNFQSALNLLNNSQLENKIVEADLFNAITADIVNLETQYNPDFKENVIKCQVSAPANIKKGEVWWQIQE